MGPGLRSLIARYGFAVAAVTAAIVVRALLDPLVGDRLPFLFSSLAVIAAAWHGGFGPSILALVLGLVSVAYFFLPPRYELSASLAAHPIPVIGFLFLGVTIGLFSERLRAARHRAEALAAEAIRRRHEVEQEVAQRKLLEHELQQRNEALAQADRRKDEFLAMLGHELRNPLGPIRNAVHVMRMLGLADPQLRWARDVIDRQVDQMARLVDDLLDVSRISRGKIALRKESVDFIQVVRRAVESSRPLLQARKHDLSVTLPTRPVWLEADPIRLAQVATNLLNNAIKYTAEEGRLRLIVERNDDQVVMRVQDNGIGITPDMLPRVFDLFAQADCTLDRSDGGLGIGLTLVKSLVELHGGQVEAFSAGPGTGSEFLVRLPIGRAECGPPVDAASPTTSATSARRILAVDDNVDSVESLARLLGLQGHDVRTAYDGPTALATAEEFQPQVVFLDIGLPRMDGYEVARRLREKTGLQDILLVAVTGYGQEDDRRRATEAGFDRHLVKPADLNLLQALLTATDRGSG